MTNKAPKTTALVPVKKARKVRKSNSAPSTPRKRAVTKPPIASRSMIVLDPDGLMDVRGAVSYEAMGFWLDLVMLANGHDSFPDDDVSISTLLGTDIRIVRRLKKELVEAGMIKPRFGVRGDR